MYTLIILRKRGYTLRTFPTHPDAERHARLDFEGGMRQSETIAVVLYDPEGTVIMQTDMRPVA